MNTPLGKGANAFVLTSDTNIYLRKNFFNARGGSAIAGQTSRALTLIHEAIHVAGYSDDYFGGSTKLDDVVIKSCWSRFYGHNDLSTVGN